MKAFEVDSEKLITSFHYHDQIFDKLEIADDRLFVQLTNETGNEKTKITLQGLEYLEVKELIPRGIVLSCYIFELSDCPSHLKGSLDFTRLRQYIKSQNIKIFYSDGTMGFEILAAFKRGFSETL